MAIQNYAERSVIVVPHASTNFVEGPAAALWIGTAGTLSYAPYDPSVSGNVGTAVATTVGVGLFPVKTMRVNATGTTAAQIVALY